MKSGFVVSVYQDLHTHLNRTRDLTGSLHRISICKSSGSSLFDIVKPNPLAKSAIKNPWKKKKTKIIKKLHGISWSRNIKKK
jgi:hypothetical protein